MVSSGCGRQNIGCVEETVKQLVPMYSVDRKVKWCRDFMTEMAQKYPGMLVINVPGSGLYLTQGCLLCNSSEAIYMGILYFLWYIMPQMVC